MIDLELIPLKKADLSKIKLISSDLDGTLTQDSKLNSCLFQSIQKLNDLNIPIIINTGRSAGWICALSYYLPVFGGIGENGGIFFLSDEKPLLISEIQDLKSHREKLKEIFLTLQKFFPNLEESPDNLFHLTDWSFNLGNLKSEELQTIQTICLDFGFNFTFSNMHGHILPLGQNKGSALKKVLSMFFPELKLDEVLVIGDSPNDESMFQYFPISVGVKNISPFLSGIKSKPCFLASESEVSGFLEMVCSLKFQS